MEEHESNFETAYELGLIKEDWHKDMRCFGDFDECSAECELCILNGMCLEILEMNDEES